MTEFLDPDALRDLVEGLAARPGEWEALVRHDTGSRHFALLRRDEQAEVWLICWTGEDHDTGFHDHDISSGAFAVAEGELVEERLAIGRTIRRRLRRGQSLGFPPSHVHRVHGVGDTPAVSIHAYSPPLARLGVYVLAPDGALRREPVAATHELTAAPPAA
jgi:mannose-6-phosphate isomerase-like protein (cupin superfamily)